jgi:hypothetical protein
MVTLLCLIKGTCTLCMNKIKELSILFYAAEYVNRFSWFTVRDKKRLRGFLADFFT